MGTSDLNKPFAVRTKDLHIEAVVMAPSEAEAIAKVIDQVDLVIKSETALAPKDVAFLKKHAPDLMQYEAAELPADGVLDFRVNAW